MKTYTGIIIHESLIASVVLPQDSWTTCSAGAPSENVRSFLETMGHGEVVKENLVLRVLGNEFNLDSDILFIGLGAKFNDVHEVKNFVWNHRLVEIFGVIQELSENLLVVVSDRFLQVHVILNQLNWCRRMEVYRPNEVRKHYSVFLSSEIKFLDVHPYSFNSQSSAFYKVLLLAVGAILGLDLTFVLLPLFKSLLP